MPKQVLEINNFAGGLNAYKDARDIEDTELKRIRPGFLAQDVLEVLEKSGFSSNNSMVQIDEKTTQHSMDYESMVVPLVKAVQELNAKVEELESKLNNKES